jgi:hypothetical protein
MIGWCEACGKDVDWLAVDEAARLVGSSSRTIFGLVERSELHSSETREGILIICQDSLIQASPKDRLSPNSKAPK